MSIQTFNLNGYPDGTDIGLIPGITRSIGSSSDLVVNANGYLSLTSDPSLATIDSGSFSHKFTAVYVVPEQNNSMICCVNVVNIDNFYCVRYDSGEIQLFKRFEGNFTLIASTASSFGSTGSLSLIFNAVTNRLTVQKDGVNVSGLVDINPLQTLTPSTLVGIHGRQFAIDLIDSFIIESLDAPETVIVDLSSIYVQSESPIYDGSYFNADRP